MPRLAEGVRERPTILLVEDDLALGRALRFTLRVEGYEVELMGSAEALLERAFPGGPVCLVTDLNLPGLSGMEALEVLRRDGCTAPAILITTGLTEGLRRRALQANVALLEKPILDDGLKTAIRETWGDGPAVGPASPG
jgi:CheY-like chemotaxis protein